LMYAKQTNKEDMISTLEKRTEYLTTYLPQQLNEEEVKSIIKNIIESNGFSGNQDMGKVMGLAMKELKGKTDGGLINKLVRELL